METWAIVVIFIIFAIVIVVISLRSERIRARLQLLGLIRTDIESSTSSPKQQPSSEDTIKAADGGKISGESIEQSGSGKHVVDASGSESEIKVKKIKQSGDET